MRLERLKQEWFIYLKNLNPTTKNTTIDNRSNIDNVLNGLNALKPKELYQFLSEDLLKTGSKVLLLAISRNLGDNIQLVLLDCVNSFKKNSIKANILKESTSTGWNALMLSVGAKDRFVQPLLNIINTLAKKDRHAILKKTTTKGANALMLAAKYRPENVLPLLKSIKMLNIEEQGDILKQVTGEGENVLMLLAKCRPEIVSHLLDLVVMLNVKDQLAIIHQALSVTGKLDKEDQVDILKLVDGRTLMSAAIIPEVKDDSVPAMLALIKELDQIDFLMKTLLLIKSRKVPHAGNEMCPQHVREAISHILTKLHGMGNPQGELDLDEFISIGLSLCTYIQERSNDPENLSLSRTLIAKISNASSNMPYERDMKINTAKKVLKGLLCVQLNMTNSDAIFNLNEKKALSEGRLNKALLVNNKIPDAVVTLIKRKAAPGVIDDPSQYSNISDKTSEVYKDDEISNETESTPKAQNLIDFNTDPLIDLSTIGAKCSQMDLNFPVGEEILEPSVPLLHSDLEGIELDGSIDNSSQDFNTSDKLSEHNSDCDISYPNLNISPVDNTWEPSWISSELLKPVPPYNPSWFRHRLDQSSLDSKTTKSEIVETEITSESQNIIDFNADLQPSIAVENSQKDSEVYSLKASSVSSGEKSKDNIKSSFHQPEISLFKSSTLENIHAVEIMKDASSVPTENPSNSTEEKDGRIACKM